MKKINKEMGTGIFFICFSLFYFVFATKITSLQLFGHKGLDSRSIPMVLGCLMAVLGLFQLRSGFLKLKCDKQKNIPSQEKEKPETLCFFGHQFNRQKTTLVLAIVIVALYILLLSPLGFILSSMLFLALLTLLLLPTEKRNKKMYIFTFIYSIVIPILIYIVFVKYLAMILPRGILG
ncbi:MAG: tripartite tricarboxylate transporter TctB family protein [Sphaerochaetaceae bacterium]